VTQLARQADLQIWQLNCNQYFHMHYLENMYLYFYRIIKGTIVLKLRHVAMKW